MNHILKNDGMGLHVPHGYRLVNRHKLTGFGTWDLSTKTAEDLARIGLERVCDPGQEGNLFGEVDR